MTVTVTNATERETISQIWCFKNFPKSFYILRSMALKWKGTNMGYKNNNHLQAPWK